MESMKKIRGLPRMPEEIELAVLRKASSFWDNQISPWLHSKSFVFLIKRQDCTSAIGAQSSAEVVWWHRQTVLHPSEDTLPCKPWFRELMALLVSLLDRRGTELQQACKAAACCPPSTASEHGWGKWRPQPFAMKIPNKRPTLSPRFPHSEIHSKPVQSFKI